MRKLPLAFSPVSTSTGIARAARAQLGEILRVAFEVTEILEAGAHATRLRIGLCIDAAIGLRYRVFRIGGEVVPEVFEVGPLAPVNQRQRHIAIEVKMPKVAQQPNVFPVTNAGKKGVHQHHALSGVRELRRESVSDHQSDVVADDAHAIQS